MASTKRALEPRLVKALRVSIDNYEATVLGLEGLRRALTYRSKIIVPHTWSLGRRMTPSTTGLPDVTPDAVLQMDDSRGYVIEAKRNMSSHQDQWEGALEQIFKYDDPLTGWWTPTETIPTANVAILVWNKFIRKFIRFLERTLRDSGRSFTSAVALIEFSRVQESEEVFFYRRDWGRLDDPAIADTLDEGITVPLTVIVALGEKQYRFCDSAPEPEYIMAILWQNVFNSRLPDVEFDKKLRAWPIEVTVPDLAAELQRLFGSEGRRPRERTFPREAWVRVALDAFVKLRLAEHIEDDRYLIHFKTDLRIPPGSDLIARFARHRDSLSSIDDDVEQLPLFQSASPS